MAECSSYILKCEYEGKFFICNRNESWIERLTDSTAIDWWEYNVSPFLYSCSVQILEEIPNCSNEDLKDQKFLNIIKHRYIEADPDINEDEHICDIVLKNKTTDMKKRMRAKMNELIKLSETAIRYGNSEKFTKIIMNNPYLDQWLSLPRHKFPPFEKSGISSKYLYAYLIVHKNSFKEKLQQSSEDNASRERLPGLLCELIDDVYKNVGPNVIQGYDVINIEKLQLIIPELKDIIKNGKAEQMFWFKDDMDICVLYDDSHMKTINLHKYIKEKENPIKYEQYLRNYQSGQ